MMDGQKISKKRDKWFESEDGQQCQRGVTSGQYLKNRLERAFLAGIQAAEEIIAEEIYETERCVK